LLADLRSNPPTLATWARERTDMEAAYIVVVSNHWIAVRGKWFCDTWTRGVPVYLDAAEHFRWNKYAEFSPTYREAQAILEGWAESAHSPADFRRRPENEADAAL
jgi:hypothetical protein